MANIRDVARLAGVSSSTVSRIVNNTKPVSLEVRKRVEEAIKETGYKPNPVARSMVLKKTQVIGVLIADISNRYYAEFVRGIENAAFDNGYSIMLCDSNFSKKAETEYLELMRDKMVDGIIVSTRVLGEHFKEFSKNNDVPIVYENRPRDNVYSVAIENEAMSFKAVEYLIQCGHEAIGCIYTAQEDISTGYNRFEGYKHALKKYGLKFNSKTAVMGDFSIESGYQAMNTIIDAETPVTAVFATTDEMAFGAYAALADRGIKIPEDISIVGFDDIDLSKYLRPQLTTIHQPISRIGVKTVELLLRLINDDYPTTFSLFVDTELRIRNSVKTIY